MKDELAAAPLRPTDRFLIQIDPQDASVIIYGRFSNDEEARDDACANGQPEGHPDWRRTDPTAPLWLLLGPNKHELRVLSDDYQRWVEPLVLGWSK